MSREAETIDKRIHYKTETCWLIESGSPCEYVSELSTLGITKNPWLALRYSTKEKAEWALHNSCFEKCREWRILDHIFYG